MKKKLKKYMGDGLMIAGTGIGLSIASGLDDTGATGKLSKAMPIVGGIYGAGMVMDGLSFLDKKSKKWQKKLY